MTQTPNKTKKTPKACQVLIAEDDPFISKLYEKKFALEGFKTLIAMDGKSAIKLAMTFKPDIIFLDIMMPKVSGLQALKTLKRIPQCQNIPVFIITNSALIEEAKKAKKLGAIDFIVKTNITPQELVEKTLNVICSSCQLKKRCPQKQKKK